VKSADVVLLAGSARTSPAQRNAARAVLARLGPAPIIDA
jgi:hypothetical protein